MNQALRAFNLFGCKLANAHRYPAPVYRRLYEPCAGAAGYSLLHHTRDVILSDIDPYICRAWRYLIGASPEEILRLPLIEPEQLVTELDCEPDAQTLIAFCCNQMAKPAKKLSSWGIHWRFKSASYWGERRRKQMAVVCERVKHWTIINCSYEAMMGNDAATRFVDFPYEKAGKSYRFNRIDYAAAAEWCRTRNGQTIVCEATGATWLPFQELYRAPSQNARVGTRKPYREAVWISPVTEAAQ